MLTSSPATTTSGRKTQVRLVGGVRGSWFGALGKEKVSVVGQWREWWVSSVASGPSATAWRQRGAEPVGGQLGPALTETSPAPTPCCCLSQSSTPVMWNSYRVRTVDFSMGGWVCVTSLMFLEDLYCVKDGSSGGQFSGCYHCCSGSSERLLCYKNIHHYTQMGLFCPLFLQKLGSGHTLVQIFSQLMTYQTIMGIPHDHR